MVKNNIDIILAFTVYLGLMMAMVVLAIIPIVIFYMICQKWIIQGVIAGAVKG